MKLHRALMVVAGIALLATTATDDIAQAQQVSLAQRSGNRPLKSFAAAGRAALRAPRTPRGFPYVVPNRIPKEDLRTQVSDIDAADELTQQTIGAAAVSVASGFDGASNDDNASVFGFRVAPPDTDVDVGRNYIVQSINLLTTIFNKSGTVVSGPFPTNAIWTGAGGLCEPYNQGDPIVLFDETNNRWLISQFAFDNNFLSYAMCVAVSTTDDPTGSFNRYEWSFTGLGLPDYPKLGIVSESIALTANIFQIIGPFFSYAGPLLGVMDKEAMYNGDSAWLVGSVLGSSEFGFVAGDLDDPSGTAGFVPALFATAMSGNFRTFNVWEVDVDWTTATTTTAPTYSTSRVSSVNITRFDPDLCGASREACIPQPGTSQKLEAISDRLMHRLQIRDYGAFKSMMAAHTVDVGSGRAGVRWYEFRSTGGNWPKYQEGTFAPDDGRHRWMPSIAKNAAGDIGLGYLISDANSTYMSTAVTGQTASNSGSDLMDAAEVVCQDGSGAQTQTARSGDYSATVVDPVTDTFWHTNEYVPTTGVFQWATTICEFVVSSGSVGPQPPAAPSNLVASAVSPSEINVTWTNTSNGTPVDYIELERSEDGGSSFSVIATLGPTVSSYPDTGLPPLATRHYRAQAFSNTEGGSGYSNTDNATTFSDGPQPPAAPSDLVASAVSTSEIDVTWTNNSNSTPVDYIELERSEDGGGSFSVIATLGPTDNSYPDTGLPPLATRHYRAQAFSNTEGGSGYSNTDNATTFSDAGPQTVHVENIQTGTNNSRGNKSGYALVTVFDDTGQPVSGATVEGSFGGSYSEDGSGLTNGSGVAEINTLTTQRGGVSVDFCVNDILASLPYEPADNGNSSYACPGTGVVGKGVVATETPDGYRLAQNFPNPFNPVTAISFELPEAGHVVLKVYNVVGKEIATLVDGYQEEGRHSVRFDASGLSTGLYIYTIKVGPYLASRRMSLLK